MRAYIGIDVGSNGAIAAINENGDILYYHRIYPELEKTIEIIDNCILQLEENHTHITVGIEDVKSIFGSSASSNFKFGRNKGIVEAIIAVLKHLGVYFYEGFDIELVPAKVWQNRTWIDSDIVWNKRGSKREKDTKATSLNAANRLFTCDFIGTKASRKPHDGVVDAILIANYLKNK
jgi:hypothetical protein